jgi:hypothetical protein
MNKKYLFLLFLTGCINAPMMAQDTKVAIADTTAQVKKESKRVNNTQPVEDIVVPILEPKPLILTAVDAKMSKGENPGVQMDIPEVVVDDLQRDLEKSIRNKTKSKLVKSDSEMSIENTIISEIGDDPINVFVQLTSLDSGARVTAFVEDQGKFISEKEGGEKYARMSSYLRDFGLNAYREKVSGQIKLENKTLSDLESDLNKLRKSNEKMHEDISKNESSITNAETDIKSSTKEQEIVGEEIVKQKLVVGSAADKDAKKLENKKLNGLEKQKDKARDNVTSLNKSIVKSRAEIENLEAGIKSNLQEQQLLQDKISMQRGFVKGLEGKLAKIK